MNKQKITMCFGTFDHFHPGHASYLQQAFDLGSSLIVVVSRDKTVQEKKGHQTYYKETKRLSVVQEQLQKLEIKGQVILGRQSNYWNIIIEHKPKYIALGYDQDVDIDKLKEYNEKHNLEIIIKRMNSYYPNKYKSKFCII